MYNPFSLESKTILVTGASSGIGRAIAIECSRMGARILLTGRNKERLEETYSALQSGDHMVLPADMNNANERAALTQTIPCVDGIVHNAGISRRSLCKHVTAAEISLLMSTNFEAPVLLQQAIMSAKKLNKEASVVFVASKAADFPAVGNAVYSASKGALISYARTLALEVAPRKTRVNCICPAMVWTDLVTADGSMSKEQLEEAQLKYPLKRYGQPQDIAYLAIYLLSDASSWMTGSCLDITGGGEGTLV